MKRLVIWTLAGACALAGSGQVLAAPAIAVLGKDLTFPNRIEGLPAKLSGFPDLQIRSFTTSDGVKLAYWEAGAGKPLIFVPGWTGNGAQCINLLYLLRQHHHVYVLDPPDQGPSQSAG